MHCLANDRCKRCNVTFNNRQSASCSAAACSLVRHYLPPAPGPWAAGTAVGTAGSCGNLRPRAIVMIEHWAPSAAPPAPRASAPANAALRPGAPCRRQLRGEVHAAAAATAAPTEITRVQTGAHTARASSSCSTSRSRLGWNAGGVAQEADEKAQRLRMLAAASRREGEQRRRRSVNEEGEGGTLTNEKQTTF